MSGRKNNLSKFRNITNGDMSQASITSSVTNIGHLDNVGIQLDFTGSPVGYFEIQVSADYDQDFEGNVVTAGNWVSLAFTYLSSGTVLNTTQLPASVGSPIYVDLTQLSSPWIRVKYTKTSGTGTLNGYITAKMV